MYWIFKQGVIMSLDGGTAGGSHIERSGMFNGKFELNYPQELTN